MFESSKTNIDCLDPVSLQVQRVGGSIPFFGLLGIFLLISLVVFYALHHRSEQINEDQKELPENLYKLWENDNEFKHVRGAIELDDISMNDAAIWSHVHRMYLIGSNSISFPWYIPKDFPRDALKKSDREMLCEFIDDVNV